MKIREAIQVSSLLAMICLGLTGISGAETQLPDPDGKSAFDDPEYPFVETGGFSTRNKPDGQCKWLVLKRK